MSTNLICVYVGGQCIKKHICVSTQYVAVISSQQLQSVYLHQFSQFNYLSDSYEQFYAKVILLFYTVLNVIEQSTLENIFLFVYGKGNIGYCVYCVTYNRVILHVRFQNLTSSCEFISDLLRQLYHQRLWFISSFQHYGFHKVRRN